MGDMEGKWIEVNGTKSLSGENGKLPAGQGKVILPHLAILAKSR